MKKIIFFLITIALLISCDCSFAQFGFTPNNFLQGQWLEVGVNHLGAFGTSVSAPAGFHPRSGNADDSTLASVYDYGHDGWTIGTPAYFGDYTMPGGPFEGWELQINGTDRNQAFTTESAIGGTSGHTLIGDLVSSSTAPMHHCYWTGTAGPSHALAISMETRVDTNASWVTVTVNMHNTGDTAIPDIYYMRSCDPDNDEALGGFFSTHNKIEYQNDTAHRVMVSATGETYSNAYLGLGTKDRRAVALVYESWPLNATTDLSTVWDGTFSSDAQYAVDSSLNGDYAIGLVFKIGTLAAGDSTSITYAYVYNGVSGLDSAYAPVACSGTPVAGTINSSTSSACASTLVTLTDSGSTTGAAYQWQSSMDSSTWSNISGATTTTYSFTGLTANTYYRCMVSCTYDTTMSTPTAPVLETYTSTCPCLLYNAGTVVSDAPYACTSVVVYLSDSTYSAYAVSLQWQSSTDSSTWADIAGATSNNYSFAGLTTTTYYRLKVICLSGGEFMVSAGKKVTYSATCICTGTPDAGMATADTTYCSSCTLTLGLSGSSTADSLSYQWQYSPDDVTWTDLPGATTVPYSFAPASTYYYRCIVSCIVTGTAAYSSAVLVTYSFLDSVDVFLQGRWLQVGVNKMGAFGSIDNAPAGYYPRGAYYIVSDSSLASVYDNGHDGWTTGSPEYFGDYTITGDPFEGWELQINGTDRSQAFTSNSPIAITGTTASTLSGHLTDHTIAGGADQCTWTGTADSSGTLAIKMKTRIDTNASWVVVTVSMHNTGSTPVPNIYYMRSCDPDNDEALSSNFATNNTIDYQNDSAHRVMASATGEVYSTAYLGLGTKDSRAVAVIYEAWPLSADTDLGTLWNESYTGEGAQYSAGGTLDGDYALGLVFNIGTLAPGYSTTIKYAYIYSTPTDIDSAFLPPCTDIPVAGIITGSATLCVGSSITLADTIAGGVWSASNANATVNTAGVVTGVTTGADSITYTATTICGSATVTIPVTIIALPTAGTITGADTISIGSIATLSDSTAGGTWSSSDSTIVSINAVTGVVTAVSAGTATITYSVPGCGTPVIATKSVTVTLYDVSSGIHNISSAASYLVIYPNPTNGKLNIQWQETRYEKGMVTIADITGRELYKGSLNMNQGSGTSQLDLSGYIDGIYVISIRSGDINYNSKVVVQH